MNSIICPRIKEYDNVMFDYNNLPLDAQMKYFRYFRDLKNCENFANFCKNTFFVILFLLLLIYAYCSCCRQQKKQALQNIYFVLSKNENVKCTKCEFVHKLKRDTKVHPSGYLCPVCLSKHRNEHKKK